MLRTLLLIALTLPACSNEPGPFIGDTADVSVGDVDVTPSRDASTAADAMDADAMDDADAPDLGVDLSHMGCEALTPAACMADDACTLAGGCVDATGTPPLDFLQNNWVGTAESSGDKSFPIGETDAMLSLYRSNAFDVRGILILPDHGVRHVVWGGISSTGELGVYFGPAECPDPVLCNVPFAPAYEAGGVATDLTLDFADITVNPSIVDFSTAVSLALVPSDGFKPVFPLVTRDDALVASWLGDMVAVDEAGNAMSLYCDFDIDTRSETTVGGERVFGSFNCMDNDTRLTSTPIASADDDSIAHANGVGWFALGPDPDDLLFVGRVGVDGPWEGVVARRGDVWTPGAPIDPEAVPLEALRGTFKFHGLSQVP